jgi:hypothetical protein
VRRALVERGIEDSVAHADNKGVRLLLLAATALLGGGNASVTGTVTANTGAMLTVSSGDRALTCAVLGEGGRQAILRWGTGARVAMTCRRTDGGKLVLAKLARLDSKEKRAEPPATTTGTETHPATTMTETRPPLSPTPAPVQPTRTVRGVVAFVTGDGVGVKLDEGGETARCSITPAPDSQAAKARLTVGAHVSITCRLDGGRYVLSSVS